MGTGMCGAEKGLGRRRGSPRTERTSCARRARCSRDVVVEDAASTLSFDPSHVPVHRFKILEGPQLTMPSPTRLALHRSFVYVTSNRSSRARRSRSSAARRSTSRARSSATSSSTTLTSTVSGKLEVCPGALLTSSRAPHCQPQEVGSLPPPRSFPHPLQGCPRHGPPQDPPWCRCPPPP